MSFDLLNPVLQHHIVNSLGWAGLRPLQEQAITPLLAGDDALLLAPTAGGKTEAALFPLLTRMHQEQWDGTSVLYVTPLRALLNNLEPRIKEYAGWLGRTVGVRHGDTTAGQRARLLRERPDILLTTPESLEAMLISVRSRRRRPSPTCARSSSTRCTPSRETTGVGICRVSWTGSWPWLVARSSG